MPRAPGQFDESKRAAILQAAAEVFAERGFAAPLEAIAKRAGVSKQTVYNRFGGREALLRQVVEEQKAQITAVLDAPGADAFPEDTLAAYAEALLQRYAAPLTLALMRVAISAATKHPAVTRAIFEAGPKASRQRLGAYLRRETELGRLVISDPDAAAEAFAGMAIGQMLLSNLLGAGPDLDGAALHARARECARRFLLAYAPLPPLSANAAKQDVSPIGV